SSTHLGSCGRSGSKCPARVVLASLSRRRFHGGFHAYLLSLIGGDHSPIARGGLAMSRPTLQRARPAPPSAKPHPKPQGEHRHRDKRVGSAHPTRVPRKFGL